MPPWCGIRLLISPRFGISRNRRSTMPLPATRRGLADGARTDVRAATEPAFNLIAGVARQEPCVVMASWSVLGAQLAQERLGVPLATAYLCPTRWRNRADRTESDFFPDWFCPTQSRARLAGFPMFPDALLRVLPPNWRHSCKPVRRR